EIIQRHGEVTLETLVRLVVVFKLGVEVLNLALECLVGLVESSNVLRLTLKVGLHVVDLRLRLLGGRLGASTRMVLSVRGTLEFRELVGELGSGLVEASLLLGVGIKLSVELVELVGELLLDALEGVDVGLLRLSLGGGVLELLLEGTVGLGELGRGVALGIE